MTVGWIPTRLQEFEKEAGYMDKQVGLTDEEISNALDEQFGTDKERFQFVAQAQLKKVVEWGNEDCLAELHRGGKRRNCPECWQSLLDEVK